MLLCIFFWHHHSWILFSVLFKWIANFSPLSTMALNYAKQGVTSLDEVFKVAEYIPEIVGDIDATI